MLSSNQIVSFFRHQYLLKKSVNFLDFLHRELPRKETGEVTTFSWERSSMPNQAKPANLWRVFLGHTVGKAILKSWK